MPDAIETVLEFYQIHDNQFGKQMFLRLIDQKYDFELVFKNGNHLIVSPLKKLMEDFEIVLGRIGWVVMKECKVFEVIPDGGFYVKKQFDLIVYEDDYIRLDGFSPKPNQIHILVARAKRPSLLNYKKFRSAIDILLKKYNLITASSASAPDKLIGQENNWRFIKGKTGATRLREYWKNVGFLSLKSDPHKMYICREY